MPVADNPNLQPAPDDFLAIIRRQQLGKLKIYLGPCPGVGKTYQMLVEGNRLRRQGVDVVIGYVEPHDRSETTAQIANPPGQPVKAGEEIAIMGHTANTRESISKERAPIAAASST